MHFCLTGRGFYRDEIPHKRLPERRAPRACYVPTCGSSVEVLELDTLERFRSSDPSAPPTMFGEVDGCINRCVDRLVTGSHQQPGKAPPLGVVAVRPLPKRRCLSSVGGKEVLRKLGALPRTSAPSSQPQDFQVSLQCKFAARTQQRLAFPGPSMQSGSRFESDFLWHFYRILVRCSRRPATAGACFQAAGLDTETLGRRLTLGELSKLTDGSQRLGYWRGIRDYPENLCNWTDRKISGVAIRPLWESSLFGLRRCTERR